MSGHTDISAAPLLHRDVVNALRWLRGTSTARELCDALVLHWNVPRNLAQLAIQRTAEANLIRFDAGFTLRVVEKPEQTGQRVIVTGGRHFKDVVTLWEAFDDLHAREPIGWLFDGASDDVTGPYEGADFWARQWARAHGVVDVQFHADWKGQGRSAGPRRNRKMRLESAPTLLVAFEGGRGTADMIDVARASDLPVIRIPFDLNPEATKE